MLIGLTNQDDSLSKSISFKFRLYLAYISSALQEFPKSVEATISSNVLKPGEVFVPFDSLVNSINPNVEPGESPYNGKITLTPIIEGISKKTLSWSYKNAGKRFIAVWERCSDNQKFIAGDLCSGGLEFTYTSIGSQEKGLAGIATSFAGGECPEPYWFYDGPLPLAAPDLVAPDATTFALSANSQYQLGQNTVATTLSDITNVTASDIGRIIEVIGTSTTNPTTIEASAKFSLNKGIDFVATAGSKITFLVMSTGANSYTFLELHRA